jgi:hypothetical protein
LLAQGKRREGLLRAAEEYVCGRFGVVSLVSKAMPRLFSTIAAHRRALGKPISHADAQIAAITRARGAMLATRNISDFDDCGFDLINPWDGYAEASAMIVRTTPKSFPNSTSTMPERTWSEFLAS